MDYKEFMGEFGNPADLNAIKSAPWKTILILLGCLVNGNGFSGLAI